MPWSKLSAFNMKFILE